jgi:hypothetical protein
LIYYVLKNFNYFFPSYNGFANNKTNNNNNANFINNNSEAIFTVENFPSGAKYEGQIINGKKNG